MTKEEMIAHFGIEIPPQYLNFVLIQNPLWSAEHFQAALKIAQSYDYNIKNEKKDTTIQ